MINFIEVQGFKRFHKQPFTLAPLTVLAGLNGSGKTSLIHSLLLLREASKQNEGGIVELNGPYGLELGTAGDVLNWNSDNGLILEARDANGTYQFNFDWPTEDAMHLHLTKTPETSCDALRTGTRTFTYLCAERLGPRSSHKASSLPDELLEVGVKGENCAQILEREGNKPVNEDLLHPASHAPSLLKYEVERWLSDIARPIELNAERYPASTVYALKFRSPDGTWVRATNMGFGVTYALPIILAGLTAKIGSLLIVENPEAHLHPQGQSHMGAFLAWLASKGIQVVAETHSDHVINGIRRVIGEKRLLSCSDALVYFFGSEEKSLVQQLSFNERGGISDWPQGFFDQYQIDTAALGQIRRRIN